MSPLPPLPLALGKVEIVDAVRHGVDPMVCPVYGTGHRMSGGIDTGDVILEEPLALGRPRTIDALFKVAYTSTWSLLPAAVDGLARGTLGCVKQAESGAATQWFSMHPVLRSVVQAKLEDGSFWDRQEHSLHERFGPGHSPNPPGGRR